MRPGVLQQLRADPQSAAIPVVALTASMTGIDHTQISAAGFDTFVSKPISVREFLDTVQRLLQGANK